MWMQHEITLSPRPRGFHLITRDVLEAIPELRQLRVGLLHLFIQHTSASLSINENADPDVPVDLEMALNCVVPETLPYVHTLEGPDDSPTGSPNNPHKLVFAVPSVKRARQELIEAGVTMYEIAGEGEVVRCDGEDVEAHRFQLIGPI